MLGFRCAQRARGAHNARAWWGRDCNPGAAWSPNNNKTNDTFTDRLQSVARESTTPWVPAFRVAMVDLLDEELEFPGNVNLSALLFHHFINSNWISLSTYKYDSITTLPGSSHAPDFEDVRILYKKRVSQYPLFLKYENGGSEIFCRFRY